PRSGATSSMTSSATRASRTTATRPPPKLRPLPSSSPAGAPPRPRRRIPRAQTPGCAARLPRLIAPGAQDEPPRLRRDGLGNVPRLREPPQVPLVERRELFQRQDERGLRVRRQPAPPLIDVPGHPD